MGKRNKQRRERKPINKKKIIQSVIIIVLALAMVLSVAATLIYAIAR